MTYSEAELRKAFAKAVYFHAVGGPLTHNAGCLAEGVLELGIPVKLSTPQVTSRPVSMPLKGVDLAPLVSEPYAGFAGYIVDISHTNQFAPFDGIAGGRLAYLNQSDTATFSRMPDEHLLFAAHENTFAVKGGTRRPVAFGLSNGLIAATRDQPAFKDRRRVALRNFRATLHQQPFRPFTIRMADGRAFGHGRRDQHRHAEPVRAVRGARGRLGRRPHRDLGRRAARRP